MYQPPVAICTFHSSKLLSDFVVSIRGNTMSMFLARASSEWNSILISILVVVIGLLHGAESGLLLHFQLYT